jgi:Family of unknown function (DUF6533)
MSSFLLPVNIHELFNGIYSRVFQALLTFDTLLTLPSEMKYVWCDKRKLGLVLYIMAHYPALALLPIEMYLIFFVTSLQVCEYWCSSVTSGFM